jgi:hypothetical protein
MAQRIVAVIGIIWKHHCHGKAIHEGPSALKDDDQLNNGQSFEL